MEGAPSPRAIFLAARLGEGKRKNVRGRPRPPQPDLPTDNVLKGRQLILWSACPLAHRKASVLYTWVATKTH